MLKGFFRKFKASGEGGSENYPPLTHSLEENIRRISEIFRNDETLIIRRLHNISSEYRSFCIIYIDGMVDVDVLNENIIEPIQSRTISESIRGKKLLNVLMESIIESNRLREVSDIDTVLESMLCGDTLLLVNGCSKAVLMNSKGFKPDPLQSRPRRRWFEAPGRASTNS